MRQQARRWLSLTVVVVVAACLPGIAGAQVFTPTFMAPRSSSDFGIYLSDGPGDLAAEAIWRRASAGYDFGLRIGVADVSEDLSLLIGGELRNRLNAGTAPIDLAMTAGLQGVIGELSGLGAQLGLSLGAVLVPGAFSITPYIHPRIGAINRIGGDDEFDLDLLADLGIDFGISPNLSLRLGIAFEQPGAGLGFGLAWR